MRDDINIDKPDFSEMVKEHIPFTPIPNFVAQNYCHEALCIWVHLISLPPTWKVNRAYLMNKFGWGRDKLDKNLKHLIANHLLEYVWHKKPDGTVDKVSIKVKNGNDYQEKIINKQEHESTTLKTRRVDKSTTLKTHSVDNPLSGKTAPIKEIYIKKEKEKKREAAPKKSGALSLSLDFKPDELRQVLLHRVAAKVGLSPEALLSKFISQNIAKGNIRFDWQAELESYLIRERPVAQTQAANQEVDMSIHPTRLSPQDPRHPQYESFQRMERIKRERAELRAQQRQ